MADPDFFENLFSDEPTLQAAEKERGRFQPKGKREVRPKLVSQPSPLPVSEGFIQNNRKDDLQIGTYSTIEEGLTRSSVHSDGMMHENWTATEDKGSSKDARIRMDKIAEKMTSEVVQGQSRVEDANLYSDVGLPDDFCLEPTSTTVKATRKFQPKVCLHDKNLEVSKLSASSNDAVGHNNATIIASSSVLIDRSPDLLSQEAAVNENTRDVLQGSPLPSDLVSFSTVPFEIRPTMDALPHFEESYSPHKKSNVHEEASIDSAHEFTHDISHVEPGLSDLIGQCSTPTEQPNCEETSDYHGAENFDLDLEESLSSIAHGVGKFPPKPRRERSADKLKTSRGKVAKRISDDRENVDREGFENQIHDKQTGEISGSGKMTQNLNRNKRSIRKKKNASDEPAPMEHDPPKKKFSHSTRRKKRQVDNMLLEIPEDEIDTQKLPLKDLILLAEARERASQKAQVKAESAGLPGNSGSNGGLRSHDNAFTEGGYDHDMDFSEWQYDHDNASAEGQDPDYEGEDATPVVDASSIKLNYHSYMKKSRREKWSKTDMVLFYQAIRQFGTDFSMIQQLFPGKSRHQVHLKFKSEERKHPLQIADALVHRSKDHSHFKQVIEQLKVKAEKEKEEELTSENFDDATTSMHEDEGVKNFDDEDQEMNDMDYDDGAAKYDGSNWDDYDYNDSQYGYQ